MIRYLLLHQGLRLVFIYDDSFCRYNSGDDIDTFIVVKLIKHFTVSFNKGPLGSDNKAHFTQFSRGRFIMTEGGTRHGVILEF